MIRNRRNYFLVVISMNATLPTKKYIENACMVHLNRFLQKEEVILLQIYFIFKISILKCKISF
jgi:hypothetical protein